MNKITRYIIIALSLFIIQGCMNDDELWEQNPLNIPAISTDSTHGLFIVNEGNFMYDNASLSFYNIDDQKVYNQIFFNTNGLILGDVALSMERYKNLAYVVINNSGKIYVFDTNDYSFKGKITGLTSPRYIHFINDNKAYVSDLYARSITIINPASLEISGYINVNNNESQYYQHSTEQMLSVGKYVYVNCWSYDNKILIIDSEIDALVDSITVPLQPKSMLLDKNNMLWVACDGGFQGSTYGHEEAKLIKINTSNNQIESSWVFGLDDDISNLAINGSSDTIYFIKKDVYRHAIDATSTPQIIIYSPYSASVGGFNGLGIDPLTSEIYVADAKDFNQKGCVYRYNPMGNPIDTFDTGIIPTYFEFSLKLE